MGEKKIVGAVQTRTESRRWHADDPEPNAHLPFVMTIRVPLRTYQDTLAIYPRKTEKEGPSTRGTSATDRDRPDTFFCSYALVMASVYFRRGLVRWFYEPFLEIAHVLPAFLLAVSVRVADGRVVVCGRID